MPVSCLLYNGKLYPSDTLLISPDNRSFRYGDGFFETMKMINGNVILKELHMERLFCSLELMQFDKPEYFTPAYMLQQIQALAHENGHEQLTRIRLVVFRGNGSLYDEDNQPNCLIQSWRLDELPAYNNKGLITAIYKDARKTADAFSIIKSNNQIPHLRLCGAGEYRGGEKLGQPAGRVLGISINIIMHYVYSILTQLFVKLCLLENPNFPGKPFQTFLRNPAGGDKAMQSIGGILVGNLIGNN